jgi:esterase/lipase superfamily enzyme
MKHFMVVTTLAGLLALYAGCSGKPDGATQQTSDAKSSSRQETAWKVGDSATGIQPAEVRPSPHAEQAPGSLPLTVDGGGASSAAGARTDLKAPPAMVGEPKEDLGAMPRAAKTGKKPPQALGARAADVHATDSGDSPPLSLHDPRGRGPAAAADPPSAGAPPGGSPRSASSSAATPRTLRERLGSGLSNSAASSVDPSGVATVRVFYGTNRQPLEVAPLKWQDYARHFLWPGVLGGMTIGCMVLRGVGVKAGAMRVCTLIGVMATLTWSAFSGYQTLKEYRIATRAGQHYGGERGALEMGTCDVTIPGKHEIGEVEAPSIWRLEFREDPTKHVVFMGAEPVESGAFFKQLQERVGRSPRKDAFVFVHGFNVAFEDAAKRTAQIAYDLSFEGAPIFFSWPSQGSAFDYTVDKENSEWAATDIRDFLKQVADHSGAEQIHLIAHSMGNRALTYALRGMSVERPGQKQPPADQAQSPGSRVWLKQRFNEIVLTAPDIDADIFRTQIAPAVTKVANRVTLYASSHDQALKLSKEINGYPRAGDSGDGLVVVKGIDTIDVSAVDTSLVGHSYYGSSDTVLTDIWDLIKCAKSPDLRESLRPRDYAGGLKYWVFEPKETASTASPGTDELRR